jgi:hypothetical protein
MPPYRAESVTSGGPRARAMDGSEHDGVCTMYIRCRHAWTFHRTPGSRPTRVSCPSGAPLGYPSTCFFPFHALFSRTVPQTLVLSVPLFSGCWAAVQRRKVGWDGYPSRGPLRARRHSGHGLFGGPEEYLGTCFVCKAG